MTLTGNLWICNPFFERNHVSGQLAPGRNQARRIRQCVLVSYRLPFEAENHILQTELILTERNMRSHNVIFSMGLLSRWIIFRSWSDMEKEFQEIVDALNHANVRYVVAGGLAVVAHGYLRLTMDVDLVIDLQRDNLLRGLNALERVGYKSRLPVAKEQIADAQTRETWIKEKNMMVFPLWNPSHEKGMVIDIFVKCPFDFADEYAKAKWIEMDSGTRVPFIGLDCLLKMKKAAGRPKDLVDIEYLERVRNERSSKQ